MKINIIHHNNSSDVIVDAQTIDYIVKRCKEKTEIKHLLVTNNDIEQSTINIFVDTFNSILFDKAKFNIYIPNQHKFHKNWIYVLDKFDLIICKTNYCYESVKQYVNDKEKIKYIGWKSYDFYHNSIDKDYDEWLLLYSDPDYLDVQTVIDLWKPEYPVLNIVFSGVNLKKDKRKNLVNMNYIEKIDNSKFEILFNKCAVHICLNEIDNFNYNVNQCMMVKSVPIILDKGPVCEIVNDDCCFKVSSVKKKLKHSLGSHYKYSAEDLEAVIKKVINTSEATLEIMGNTGYTLSHKNNNLFTSNCVKLLQNCFKKTIHIKWNNKEIKEKDLPSVSLITTYRNAKHMFKLSRLNYLSSNYPRDKLEWVIVDDSDEGKTIEEYLPPESLMKDFNITFVKSDKINEGQKLNLAVSKSKHDVIICMNYDDFFYENSIRELVTKLVKSKGRCVGVTNFGCFDINRYISIINIESVIEYYYNRIYTGGLTFYKEYYDDGNYFNEEVIEKIVDDNDVEHEKLDVLSTFFDRKYNDFTEITWDNILIGLVHKGNSDKRIIDKNQQPNGCHFKLSKKVFEFICSLDGKLITTDKPEIKDENQVNNPEVKEI